MEEIQLGHIPARVVRKKVKHIRLRIVPPHHEVHISVPRGLPIETAQALAMSKYAWLNERLAALHAHDEEVAKTRLPGRYTFLWGNHCSLIFAESISRADAIVKASELRVHVRPGASEAQKQSALEAWYRQELERALAPLLAHWEACMGIGPKRLIFQRMKTRWGTCNTAARTIRLNLALVEKPPEFLEYTLVHEMTHLLHPNHGAGFASAMDGWLPDWRRLHRELDLFPRDPHAASALSHRL